MQRGLKFESNIFLTFIIFFNTSTFVMFFYLNKLFSSFWFYERKIENDSISYVRLNQMDAPTMARDRRADNQKHNRFVLKTNDHILVQIF